MYIEPDTDIILCSDVPLSPDYQHTIYFSSASAQWSYFNSHKKYALTDYSYQRVQRGTMRVGRKAEDLYDCRYLSFRNTAFGSKRFYAFITSVEYVNNVTAEIRFEIDVLQTWMFDWDLGRCMIERTHSKTDYIGDNIAPEPIETGEYVLNNWNIMKGDDGEQLEKKSIIVAVLDTNDETAGKLYDGVFGAATLYAYTTGQVSSLLDKINSYLQQTDNIIGIYMCPQALLPTLTSSHVIPSSSSAKNITWTLDSLTLADRMDGYLPDNCKLYTYPYNYLHIDNSCGSQLALRYEFFDSGKPVLSIGGTFTQPVCVQLWPKNYKVAKASGYKDYLPESLQIAGYPVCSWKVDSYQAWVAQNTLPLTVSGAFDAGSSVLNGVSLGLANAATVAAGGSALGPQGALAGAGVGLVSSLPKAIGAMMEGYKASIASDICKGSFSNGIPLFARASMTYFQGRASVTAQRAKQIDAFFNAYGYAIGELDIPSFNNRPVWTYVKTSGAVVRGGLPADDAAKVAAILNNGLTWWANGDQVGYYGLDNKAAQRGVKP